jgi:cell division protein FtsI (penicillin-binding protein 3)
VAGVEKTFDAFLRDPANEGQPLELSLDLTVQAASSRCSRAACADERQGRDGDPDGGHTGEIVALASLPDFDPNDRPPQPTGRPRRQPIFNRAVQGVYELGSTFKIFAIAQALELGLVNPHHDRHAPRRCAGAGSGSPISATTGPRCR